MGKNHALEVSKGEKEQIRTETKICIDIAFGN
jgi:hypothetical protein